MSTQQLSLIPLSVVHATVRSYVPNRQERPADLPKLRESAATMEARVLEWFGAYVLPKTPSDCAWGLGLKLTTVRPRITQLSRRTKGPRLEKCRWIARRPTEDGGSEGWYRFTAELTEGEK